MDEIGRREIKALILAHRDRLTRFGFEWFEHFAKVNGCELRVLNQAGNGARSDDHRALFFVSIVWFKKLPEKAGRGAEERCGS